MSDIGADYRRSREAPGHAAGTIFFLILPKFSYSSTKITPAPGGVRKLPDAAKCHPQTYATLMRSRNRCQSDDVWIGAARPTNLRWNSKPHAPACWSVAKAAASIDFADGHPKPTLGDRKPSCGRAICPTLVRRHRKGSDSPTPFCRERNVYIAQPTGILMFVTGNNSFTLFEQIGIC